MCKCANSRTVQILAERYLLRISIRSKGKIFWKCWTKYVDTFSDLAIVSLQTGETGFGCYRQRENVRVVIIVHNCEETVRKLQKVIVKLNSRRFFSILAKRFYESAIFWSGFFQFFGAARVLSELLCKEHTSSELI